MNEKEKFEEELKLHMNEGFQKDPPSSNFTHLVMQKIENAPVKPTIKQKPLVGIGGWLVFGGFAVLMLIALLSNAESSFHIELPKIKFDHLWSHYSLIPVTFLAVAIFIFADTLYRKKQRKWN